MKSKIMILNVLDYSKEEKEGVRLTYILVDKNAFVDNQRFRGFTEINTFIAKREVFDIITKDLIGKELDAEFIDKKDFRNPLKSTQVLESIIVNGNNIKLV